MTKLPYCNSRESSTSAATDRTCGSCHVPWVAIVIALFATFSPGMPLAQELKSTAWTIKEAIAQLELHPRDPYLQYVALQMSRGTDEESRIKQLVQQAVRTERRSRDDQGVNAFGIFSGALAIQESLQLDRLTGETNPRDPALLPEESLIPVADLTGPTIRSHPWAKMLGDRKPAVSQLSRSVPADFFFLESRSLNGLLDLKQIFDLWGQQLLTQSTRTARTQLFAQRLLDQLALDDDETFRPLHDTAVGKVAVTGSDLFFREGTDITMLFEVKQAALFKTRLALYMAAARAAHPDAEETNGTIQGIPYTAVTTDDRVLNAYSAQPSPDVFIRSNSLTGLKRVLSAFLGKNEFGESVERLGETLEFQYVRTLMPDDAEQQEDVLLYLSDPFIRRLVGPQLKLTELRRMQCYNQLRMIGHASMFFRTQFGRDPASIDELVATGCAPKDFETGQLFCPDQGTYLLAGHGRARCSHHGHAESMTPCCEQLVSTITDAERSLYQTFLTRYNSYWRRFFDPIAVRIRMAPDHYRLETIILPLIDNTLYTGLASAFNGTPVHLDSQNVPDRNILSASVRVNKTAIASSLGVSELLKPKERNPEFELAVANGFAADRLRQIGLAFHNYYDVFRSFPVKTGPDQKSGLSWRVHILPYLGLSELYGQFKLEESWDSPHNKALIERMPAIYASGSEELDRKGRTLMQTPVGPGLLFEKVNVGGQFRRILDGTSNTIMIVEAADKQAVVWTRPADLTLPKGKEIQTLRVREPGGFLCLTADGAVHFVRETIPVSSLQAMLTRNGAEPIRFTEDDLLTGETVLRMPSRNSRNRTLFGVPADDFELGLTFVKGLGDQIGFHVYDSDPLFGFSLVEFLGVMLRGSSRGGFLDADDLMIGAMIASLTAPVYVTFEVADAEIVDRFLGRLDKLLARFAREPAERTFLFSIREDFGQIPFGSDGKIRSFALQFGPLKIRLFWTRIGQQVVVASKPYILHDIAKSSATASDAGNRDNEAAVGHAMIRLRPQHWKEILQSFELGWADSHRLACLANLGPLSSMQRAIASSGKTEKVLSLNELTARVYDAHLFCPDGGHYHVTEDGRHVRCSHHGSAADPQQLDGPGDDSGLSRFLDDFGLLTMTLTFLEDGLHAVVTIERTPADTREKLE